MLRPRNQKITMLKTVTINYGSGSETLMIGEECLVTAGIARLLSNHGAALWHEPDTERGRVGNCDDKAMGAAPENKGASC